MAQNCAESTQFSPLLAGTGVGATAVSCACLLAYLLCSDSGTLLGEEVLRVGAEDAARGPALPRPRTLPS